MKNKPDPADSSLSETMAARIEIKELGDPAHQKKITDAIEALHGVIETKIENGALHVSYDPLTTTEKKIEQAIRSTGTTIKTAATDTEGAHPDLPRAR
jgi:copper chaperone CopZ